YKTLAPGEGGTLQTDAHFDLAGRAYMACSAHYTNASEDPTTCTTHTYDTASRVSQTTSPKPGGSFNTTVYSYSGYTQSTTNPLGRVVSTTYSPSTLTTTIIEPGSLTTQKVVDLLGRVVKITDPAGNFETFAYNSLGFRVSSTHPVTGTTTISFD